MSGNKYIDSSSYGRIYGIGLKKIVKSGTDVIMDYGFWSHQDRKKAYNRARRITNNVLFHNVYCDMDIAKQRILQHNAVLYDVEIEGRPKVTGDGLDSKGAVWVNIKDLNEKNATPYALMAAGLPLINVADENDVAEVREISSDDLKK